MLCVVVETATDTPTSTKHRFITKVHESIRLDHTSKFSAETSRAAHILPKLLFLVRDYSQEGVTDPATRLTELLTPKPAEKQDQVRANLLKMFPESRRSLRYVCSPLGGHFDETYLQRLEHLNTSELRPRFLTELNSACAFVRQWTETSRCVSASSTCLPSISV